MTDHDRKLAALVQLGIARQSHPDEATQMVYLSGLSNLSGAHVEAACQRLMVTPRAEYEPMYPTLATVLEFCGLVIADELTITSQRLLGRAKADNEPTYYCLDCRDEPHGWRIFECRGVGALSRHGDGDYRHCGRLKDHLPHPFAERCACLPHNPESFKARERMKTARQKVQARKSA